MCSVNGTYSAIGITEGDVISAQKMCEKLSYRGPDDWGEYVDDFCCIQSNRFSITDVKNGKMPISNEKGDVFVIQNGEIYNFREFRAELEREGHIFRTDSDTEVIVHGYERYGGDVFSHLKGMFAAVIYDKRGETPKIVLARDRFGEKPLFYLKKNNVFYFASESSALVPLTSHEVNIDEIAHYFAFGFERNHIIKGIANVEPGTYVTVDENDVTSRRYWDFSFVPDYNCADVEALANGYLDVLTHIINQMSVEEVNYGVLLSGGIDSAIVARLLHRANKQLTVVSSGCVGVQGRAEKGQDPDFSGVEAEGNEFPYAQLFKDFCGDGYYEKRFTLDDVLHDLFRMVDHYPGGPVVNTSFPIWYYAAQKAKEKKLRVMFTGEGADELFCGYRSNRPEIYKTGSSIALRYSELMGVACGKELERLIGQHYIDPIERAQAILYSQFKGKGKEEDILMNKLRFFVGHGFVMGQHMLARADGMTMCYPVEVRMPFLHPDSFEFAYKLPSQYVCQGSITKILLRKIAQKIGVPEKIIDRPKQRTSLPYATAFYNSKYASKFQSIILREDAFVKRFLNGKNVNELVLGSRSNPRVLLALLNLEAKLRQFLS